MVDTSLRLFVFVLKSEINRPGPFFLRLVVRPPTEANPGNSHQSSSDPGLVRVRPALGHCFAYNTVRSEQHGGFKLPFSWDEGDGTGEPAWSKTIKALLERLLDIHPRNHHRDDSSTWSKDPYAVC